MKFIFAMLLLAVSSLSFAGRYKTLEQYDASYAYFVHWPVISFSQATVPVKNVCQFGEEFKTINPVKVCAKTGVVEVCTRHKDDESCRPVRKGETVRENSRTRLVYGCIAYESKDLVTSKFYQTNECAEWKRNPARGGKDSGEPNWICVRTEKVTKEYATNFDVSVTSTRGKDKNEYEVANVNFDIPACAN